MTPVPAGAVRAALGPNYKEVCESCGGTINGGEGCWTTAGHYWHLVCPRHAETAPTGEAPWVFMGVWVPADRVQSLLEPIRKAKEGR